MIERYISDGIPLTEHEREVLTILQEEAAEVIVAVSKVLRFGKHNKGPERQHDNTKELGLELGDMQVMVNMAVKLELIIPTDILEGRVRKIERLLKYLQYPE
jgi:hypothetical protein